METKIESILSGNLLTEMETLEIRGGAGGLEINVFCNGAKCDTKCSGIDNPKSGDACGGGTLNVYCDTTTCPT